jgi:hypothetical protein
MFQSSADLTITLLARRVEEPAEPTATSQATGHLNDQGAEMRRLSSP